MSGILLTKDRQIWIDTSATSTPDYAKVCAGFDSANISNNPNTSQHTFLCQSNAHTEVLGYAKEIGLSGVRYVGDDANDFIAGLEDATGEAAHANVVVVDIEGSATSGSARMWDATIEVASLGGQGGGEVTLEATVHLNGNATEGTFNTETKTFTAS